MKIYNNKKNNSTKGFLLVEVLIVCAIMTMTALAIIAVAQKSIYVSRESVHITQANFLLEEGAEVVREIRDHAWSGISNLSSGVEYYATFSGGDWSLSDTPSTIRGFTRKIVFSDVNRDASTDDIAVSGTNDTGTKLVTITVSWSEGGSTITKTLSFYLMDIFS